MKFEPWLDKTALARFTGEAYGLPITSLTFLPEGEVGCHYIAACEPDEKYFLTLLTGSRLGRLQVERLGFTLGLTRHLHDRKLFQSLVPPRRTLQGDLRSDFQGQALFLTNYIPGGNLAGNQPYSPELLISLGRLTARLHRITTDLDFDIPTSEQFNIPFETDFCLSLEELDLISPTFRMGQQKLRDLLLPQRKMLLCLLDRLKELGAAAKALQPPFVLVHTDLTPANILRTPGGELLIVDWEGARLAPAEQDLALLTGEGFPVLLAEYLREAGRPRLHPQLFAFYFYRRTLEDMTDFLVQILHENTSDEQDRHDLKWLQLDCLKDLASLEGSEEWAEGQLQSIEE